MSKKTFKIRDNLAQALNDTVHLAEKNAGELHIEIIKLNKIEIDPENPRDLMLEPKDIEDGIQNSDSYYERKLKEKESLISLSNTIKEQGIINPILVYRDGEKYKLVAGERRTLASLLAGKKEIPAKILPNKPNLLKLSLLQWIENIERSDLTLWERLRNIEKIIASYAENNVLSVNQVTATEIHRLINCSLQQGVNYHNVINGPLIVKEAIQSGLVNNLEKAAFICKSPEDLRKMLLEACIKGASLKKLKILIQNIPVKSSKDDNSGIFNLGTIKKVDTIKVLMKLIINSQELQELNNILPKFDWDNKDAIISAFKKTIDFIEKQ